jgi:hypothetical protein
MQARYIQLLTDNVKMFFILCYTRTWPCQFKTPKCPRILTLIFVCSDAGRSAPEAGDKNQKQGDDDGAKVEESVCDGIYNFDRNADSEVNSERNVKTVQNFNVKSNARKRQGI